MDGVFIEALNLWLRLDDEDRSKVMRHLQGKDTSAPTAEAAQGQTAAVPPGPLPGGSGTR